MYDEWGVADGYFDVDGHWHATSDATRSALRDALADPTTAPPSWCVDLGATPALQSRCRIVLETGDDLGDHEVLPADLPAGVHDLHPADGGPTTTLIVAPTSTPQGPRGWGVAAQIYALRGSGRGIGDLDDVARLGREAAARGAVALLLSPLHAPAPTFPQQTSPYYPSSRRWLSPLLVPVARAADGTPSSGAPSLLDRDHEWETTRRLLRARFEHERSSTQWREWARRHGDDLWNYATWCALAERHGANWRQWPVGLRHPRRAEVRALVDDDQSFGVECEFHAWLQWIADAAVRTTAATADVGLIADLAVGCSPDGADAWIHQDLMVSSASIGAPPDTLSLIHI